MLIKPACICINTVVKLIGLILLCDIMLRYYYYAHATITTLYHLHTMAVLVV